LSAFGASLTAGLLFGAIPVVRLLRGDLSGVFREEGRTGTASRRTHLWRGTLVVAQVSLAFALLIGAGLLVASFARAMRIDPVPGPEESLISPYNSRVSEGYFEAMQIDVESGRSFTIGDGADAPPVAIIDRRLAEKFWLGQDPVGRRISQGVPGVGRDEDMEWRTIVGVVENVRASRLTR